jgi:hypothetical protein
MTSFKDEPAAPFFIFTLMARVTRRTKGLGRPANIRNAITSGGRWKEESKNILKIKNRTSPIVALSMRAWFCMVHQAVVRRPTTRFETVIGSSSVRASQAFPPFFVRIQKCAPACIWIQVNDRMASLLTQPRNRTTNRIQNHLVSLLITMPRGSGNSNSGYNSQGNHYNTPGGTNSSSGSSYHCKLPFERYLLCVLDN